MAERILFNFAEQILLKLASYALQQLGLAWGVAKELKRLEITMSTITNVLLDAEEQQVTSRAVREWLRRLKDIVYDVDEVVDEFATEGLRMHLQIQGSRFKEVCYFITRPSSFKFRYCMGHKIKLLRERLDDVLADIEKLGFVVKAVDTQIGGRGREETYSFVRNSDVIGRESDKEAIMKLLMCNNDEENVVIIPIVGMGGLGKTTLAQLLYNDNRVKARFNQRLWVCVSDDFDVKRTIAKILKAAGDDDTFCDSLGIEQLQIRIRQKLSDGNFFIVLDDVWNEDRVEWIKLRDLLMVGTGGSRFVITTRSKTVATIMGTVPAYDLKGLSDDDCLSVLVKWAFKEDGDYEKHHNLVNLGREIVKKCGGVPLAARTLGGLLYSKIDECDWLSVRDNEMWEFLQKENDILPILRLSYDQMPSYLKQCFAYCSLFEKNQEIDKWKLIFLWMAQGFIKSFDPNEELEDVGERYFSELVMRSFLQEDKIDHYKLHDLVHDLARGFVKSNEELEDTGDELVMRPFLEEDKKDHYKMHDLVHDLAQFVAGGECFTVRSSAKFIPDGVRHVSLTQPASSPFHNFPGFPEPLLKVKKLRTLLSHENGFSNGFTLISTFRYLRVLDLNCPCLDQVPSSIKHLKHLRYLSMVGDYTNLPDSFAKLLNLQYLELHCPDLCEFPKGFGNLINLRYLSLSSRMLIHLPQKGIGGLTSLRTLLISSSFKLTSLSEGIEHLIHLRKLEINGCPNLVSLPSGMRYLTALAQLRIESCEVLKFSDNDLEGLRSLKFLTLRDLPGLVSLPKGVQHAAAMLTHLKFWFCQSLTMLLESLTNFTVLQTLDIISCPHLLHLPEGMQSLTALQSLHIVFCPHLSTRCRREVGEDWPKIAHVPDLYIDLQKITTMKD